MYNQIYQIFLQRVVRDDCRKPEKDIRFSLNRGEMIFETPDLMIRYDGKDIYIQEENKDVIVWGEAADPNEITRTLKELNPYPTYSNLHHFDIYQFINALDINELKELKRGINEQGSNSKISFLRRHPKDKKYIQEIDDKSISFEETMSFGWAEGTYLLWERWGHGCSSHFLYSPLYTALIPRFKIFGWRTKLRDIKPEIPVKTAIEILQKGGIDSITTEALGELIKINPFTGLREWNWKVPGITYKLVNYELYE